MGTVAVSDECVLFEIAAPALPGVANEIAGGAGN
jgi:hypothetical protein